MSAHDERPPLATRADVIRTLCWLLVIALVALGCFGKGYDEGQRDACEQYSCEVPA